MLDECSISWVFSLIFVLQDYTMYLMTSGRSEYSYHLVHPRTANAQGDLSMLGADMLGSFSIRIHQ